MTLFLLVWACAAPPSPASQSPTSQSPSSPSSNLPTRAEPALPPCPDSRAPAAPWRLAKPSDLSLGAIEAVTPPDGAPPGCGLVTQVDLDGDGALDIAQLEIHTTDGAVRLHVVTQDTEIIVATWPTLTEAGAARVGTWITPKPPGAPAPRDYLPRADAERLGPVGAVEVCEPPGGPEAILSTPAELWCYCSRWLWLTPEGVQSALTCD